MLGQLVEAKQSDREHIREAVERFMRDGGKIQQVPTNVFAAADLAISDWRRSEGFTTMKREKNK